MNARHSLDTKTHIVLVARATGENGTDAPPLHPQSPAATAVGIEIAQVVADQACLVRENMEGAAELGPDPFVPFKPSSTPKSGRSHPRRQKYLELQLRPEEFNEHYHDQTNMESTISTIDVEHGERLLYKDPITRINELLATFVG